VAKHISAIRVVICYRQCGVDRVIAIVHYYQITFILSVHILNHTTVVSSDPIPGSVRVQEFVCYRKLRLIKNEVAFFTGMKVSVGFIYPYDSVTRKDQTANILDFIECIFVDNVFELIQSLVHDNE